jgi:predicted transposase YdaD
MKNKTITDDIYQVNDGLFHKIFDNPENARDFLERVLPDQLKKMLDESKIDGGEIMPTLAQQMKEEFREEFMATIGPRLKEEGKEEGKKEGKKEGMEEMAINAAKKMLEDGLPIETISRYTGLMKKEIEKLRKIP